MKKLSDEIANVPAPEMVGEKMKDEESFFGRLDDLRRKLSAGEGWEFQDQVSFVQAAYDDPEMDDGQKAYWLKIAAEEYVVRAESNWEAFMALYYFVGKGIAKDRWPLLSWADVPIRVRGSILWQVRNFAGVSAAMFALEYAKHETIAARFFEPETELGKLLTAMMVCRADLTVQKAIGEEGEEAARAASGRLDEFRRRLAYDFGFVVGLNDRGWPERVIPFDQVKTEGAGDGDNPGHNAETGSGAGGQGDKDSEG